MKHFGTGSITLANGTGTLAVAAASFQEAPPSDLPPPELVKWLKGLGWVIAERSDGPRLQNNRIETMGRWYTWEQATAVEFFRFLHMGTK